MSTLALQVQNSGTFTTSLPAGVETLIGSIPVKGCGNVRHTLKNTGANALTSVRVASTVTATGPDVTDVTGSDFNTATNFLINATSNLTTLGAGVAGRFQTNHDGASWYENVYATAGSATTVQLDWTAFAANVE